MYAKYFKRPLDFILSLTALIVLSPFLLILTVVGAIVMKGNPFFVQVRPGKDEKLFKMIKFRTMTCEKDKNGNLLPDDMRLTKYGKILRQTSVDELAELYNIVKGEMSLIGPRPLLVEYLPYYHENERKRHNVCPGITGWAQINGRNTLTWEQKFEYDIEYIDKCSFLLDIKIIFMTIKKIIIRSDILVGSEHIVGKLDEERKKTKEFINV